MSSLPDVSAGSSGHVTHHDTLHDIHNRNVLVHSVGNSGTSLTITANTSGCSKLITLNNDCTFTLAGAVASERCVLELVLTQDGTGGRTVTWPGSVSWAGGAEPILSPTAGAIDRVVLTSYDGGTTWHGYMVGAGGASQPWEFHPENYGAVGDNSTNDQDAINDCIADAVDWATSSGNYYAEIVFSPSKTYVVSGATIKGGDGQGNAQIPLPAVATTGKKLTLVLKGGKGSDAWAHWEQTTPQVANACIRSTLTSQSIDGTWGAPSVIGAPTAGDYSSSSAFTNLRIVVDGVNVVAPANPTLIAFDFLKCAQMHVINAAAHANASPAGSPALTTTPTSTIGMGLRSAQLLNNAECTVGTFSCTGFYYGLATGEHFTATRLAFIYCHTGIYIPANGGDYHGGSILYACIEQCVDAIEVAGGSSGTFPIHIANLDVEIISGYDLNDPNAGLTGVIFWSDNSNSGAAPSVNGGGKVKVISNQRNHAPGAKTAPSVPATTVAHTNTFWRDCAVSVSGGTVTVIAVDGQSTGLTSGTVIVPSGKTITLTYSAAPSWNWVAL